MLLPVFFLIHLCWTNGQQYMWLTNIWPVLVPPRSEAEPWSCCPPTPVHINKPLLFVATSSATSSHTNCDRVSQDSARFASSSSHHGQPRTRYALCGRQRPNNKSWNGEHPRPCQPLGIWTREGIYARWFAVVTQTTYIKNTG